MTLRYRKPDMNRTSEREARLAAWCRDHGHAGVVLRRRANIAWLTEADVHVDSGSPLGVAALVWTPDEKLALTDTIEARRLAEEELDPSWKVVIREWFEPRPDPAPAPGSTFVADWPDDRIAPLRWPLTGPEIATVRALGAETAEAMQRHLAEDVRPGWTEFEVAGRFSGALIARGIEPRVVLVAADERIARYRHPIPTRKRVERTLMLVVCAQRRGLIVALTRLVSFGALSDDLRRRHDAVCAVDAALHEATRPGRRWGDLLGVARQAYAAHGFPDEWRLHHQGGPMGYEPRDFCVTPGEERAVVENQLVGWNPSITGTKSEDTILSTGEVVTSAPGWPLRGVRPDILAR